jgi:hypothetical protein
MDVLGVIEAIGAAVAAVAASLAIAPERFMSSSNQVDPLALRLWRLLRVARRRSLQRAGMIVLEWPAEVALETLLAQAREYRRFARRSTA